MIFDAIGCIVYFFAFLVFGFCVLEMERMECLCSVLFLNSDRDRSRHPPRPV